MDTDLKRRLVSVEQLQTLLEFMKEHPELARGLSRGRRGKLMTVKVWNTCASTLNSMKEGAVKDGKGWSKYWCDWKYRVRRHALEIKVAQDTKTVPPEEITALSPTEQMIMSIIGDSSIDGVVIKSDPLGDEDSNGEEADKVQDGTSAPNNQYYETRSRGIKRQRASTSEPVNQPDDEDDNDDDNDGEDSGSPPVSRARVEEEAQESEYDEEDKTSQFLRLEKKQLENAKKIHESICRMSLEICKLSDIMGEIRDVLVKRLHTIT